MFLTSDVVARARSDRSHPRDEILQRLERACDGHLGLTSNSLFELRSKSFVRWRATIEELSGMAALSPGGVHLEHLVETVTPMARGGWRKASGFDRHLAVPWVLTALAGCLDTHYDRLGHGQSAIEDIVAELAEFLSNEQATTSWGDMDRVAFNHTIIAYAALGAGALVLLEHHPDAPGWLERALEATSKFLDVGVTPAGMTWEGLTYCGYDFKYVGVLLSGLRSRGREAELVPPGSHIEEKLRRVPSWYAHEMWPTGSWLQNYNDSFSEPDRALWGLLLMFGRYEPGLCATIWDRLVGSEGLGTYGAHRLWSSLAEAMFFYPAPERGTSFEHLEDVFFAPDVGFVSARDSWTEDATVFTFNSGPFLTRARLHDQADNNSFALIACGSPMVIDSGEGNDRREGSPSSSLGHNAIFIDGLGEHPAGEGIGVSGRIAAFGSTDEAVSIVGDATESYCHKDHNPVRHVLRTAVFVRRPFPYVLIHDDINKDDLSHLYEFIVHVPDVDDAAFSNGSAFATVLDPARCAIGTIEALRPSSVHLSVEAFETFTQPFHEHRLLRFATTAVNPDFLVLLRPLPATPERPAVQIDETAEGLSVELHWSTTVDRILLPSRSSGARRDESLPTISRSLSGYEPLVWSNQDDVPETEQRGPTRLLSRWRLPPRFARRSPEAKDKR